MEGPETGLFLILLFALLLVIAPHSSIQYLEEGGSITCNNVKGEVIEKEAPFTLVVEVHDEVSNKISKYDVYVSPEAYANYSIGSTHIEPICTITDYDYYKEIIDRLLESGILE